MHRLAKLTRPVRRPLVIAAVACVVAVGVLTAGSARASAGAIYRITTGNSLALDVQGASTADLAPIIQWGVNGGRNQEWQLLPVGSHYEIVNYNSHKCITVGGATAGSTLYQYTCLGVSSQLFKLSGAGGVNVFVFQSVRSGLVLDVPGNTPVWGTRLIVWPFVLLHSDELFTLTLTGFA
jgi:hypothetical protein